MARRAEDGLSYFPMNSDIIHNSKIKLVVAEFGPKAWAVLLPLYCKIYREKGYWLDWCDEDIKLLFAQYECQVEVAFANEVVVGCIRRGLFNKAVFDSFGILTSDRIQGNYLEGKKRNKKITLIEEFLIESDDVDISGDNVNIIPLSVGIIKKNVSIGTQNRRRIKEEIKGEGDSETEHPPELVEKFKKFEDWIKKNAPNVAKMKSPFTIEEFKKVQEKFNPNTVTSLLLKMHNYKPLLKKNISAYLTLDNWSRNQYNNEEVKNDEPAKANAKEEKGRRILDSVN